MSANVTKRWQIFLRVISSFHASQITPVILRLVCFESPFVQQQYVSADKLRLLLKRVRI